jgi:hypothetical protein
MRQSTVIGLAVVTVPLALLALLLPAGTQTAAPATQPEKLFPELQGKIGAAAKLTVTGPDGSVTIERTATEPPAAGKVPADGWTLPDKGGYPVQAATIRPILGGLVQLQTVAPATARPALYDRLDLSPPGKGSEARSVTLADASGHELAQLVVGKRNDDPLGQGSDGIYVRKPDTPQTWLAKPPITLPSDALQWIDRKIVDIDTDTVKDVRLTPADGKPLEVSREKAADKLEIKDLPKDAKLKSDTAANDIAAGFRYLDLDDVRPATQITDKPVATAHLDTFDGLSADLMLTKHDNGTWVTVSASGTGAAQKQADEINQRTKGWAYKIADARATTLESTLADLEQPPEKPTESAPVKPGGKLPAGRPMPVTKGPPG